MSLLALFTIATFAIAAQANPEVPCICNRIEAPVCGTDGQTYGNKCELECAQKKKKDLSVDYEGECQTCLCTRDYAPVCGTNGITYDNICSLECDQRVGKNVALADEGECQPCICNSIYLPVCGTDGVTYDNECVLGCAQKTRRGRNLAVLKEGPCAEFVFPED